MLDRGSQTKRPMHPLTHVRYFRIHFTDFSKGNKMEPGKRGFFEALGAGCWLGGRNTLGEKLLTNTLCPPQRALVRNAMARCINSCGAAGCVHGDP